MRFIALDLETTGLSPETDTIIEVAAIVFGLAQDNQGIYRAIDIEERSMLVSPGRDMTEEISMITGITDTMLRGKPVWGDIRERVRGFIGTDSVIVGHNVLFDVSMLRTHDIDLSHHPILDTFELSEIFSQDIESLNLGYLAGKYNLSAGDKEHRALGDTRLSVGLFIYYLNQAQNLTKEKKNIFALVANKEIKPNLGLFAKIAGIDADILGKNEQDLPILLSLHSTGQKTGDQEQIIPSHPRVATLHPSDEFTFSEGQKKVPTSYTLTSIPLGRMSEGEFLGRHISRGTKTHLGVFGHAQALYMQSLIGDMGYTSHIYHSHQEYCSIDELSDRINRGNWQRKESILITKLLYWLDDTETGLLGELKLYGEEREEIGFFRMQRGQINQYYIQLQESIDNADIVIYDMSKHIQDIKDNPPIHQSTNPPIFIIKDIPLLEESMRRTLSLYISIEKVIQALNQFPATDRIIDMIRFIEAIYLELPIRPTGTHTSPPGGYGETYFMTQGDIWHHGHASLARVNISLIQEYNQWKSSRKVIHHRDILLISIIDKAIVHLTRFHQFPSDLGAIIEVQYNQLNISLIPRSVQDEIGRLFSGYDTVYGYATGLGGPKIHDFLKNELGLIDIPIHTNHTPQEKHIKINPYIRNELILSGDIGGTIILTTSAKHIREIGKSLGNTGYTILMQGISGGKGKQLGLFKNNPNGTILIGTIDMWKEEIGLWNHAKNIILAKLPFDPPTDAYFLARTVGMKNNFSLYSEPMMIIKINTLLNRIYSSTYSGYVYCEDERLGVATWGRGISDEIV